MNILCVSGVSCGCHDIVNCWLVVGKLD
jgi:hypothetical protein